MRDYKIRAPSCFKAIHVIQIAAKSDPKAAADRFSKTAAEDNSGQAGTASRGCMARTCAATGNRPPCENERPRSSQIRSFEAALPTATSTGALDLPFRAHVSGNRKSGPSGKPARNRFCLLFPELAGHGTDCVAAPAPTPRSSDAKRPVGDPVRAASLFRKALKLGKSSLCVPTRNCRRESVQHEDRLRASLHRIEKRLRRTQELTPCRNPLDEGPKCTHLPGCLTVVKVMFRPAMHDPASRGPGTPGRSW